jgi:hypothetical protein
MLSRLLIDNILNINRTAVLPQSNATCTVLCNRTRHLLQFFFALVPFMSFYCLLIVVYSAHDLCPTRLLFYNISELFLNSHHLLFFEFSPTARRCRSSSVQRRRFRLVSRFGVVTRGAIGRSWRIECKVTVHSNSIHTFYMKWARESRLEVLYINASK